MLYTWLALFITAISVLKKMIVGALFAKEKPLSET